MIRYIILIGAAIGLILYFNIGTFFSDRPLITEAGKFNELVATPAISVNQYRKVYNETSGRFDKYSIDYDNQSFEYFTYGGNKDDIAKPAIILLHGSGRTGVSMMDMWKEISDKHNVILIAPNSGSKQGWFGTDRSMGLIKAIIAQSQSTHNIDTEHLFLFGHSAGAINAMLMTMADDPPFRAVALHAGHADLTRVMSLDVNKYQKPPIAYYLGSNDHIFKINDAKKVGEYLADKGQNFDLTIYQGHNHWYYDLAPYINERAWKFFASQ